MRVSRSLPFGLGVLALAACEPKDAGPDLILVRGKVFTADSTRPWTEAIAIRGDRIEAVGTTGHIDSLAGPSTRRIDLGGRVVIPGINDAHAHLGGALPGIAFATSQAPFPDPPLALVLDSLRALVRRTPPATWLRSSVGATVLDDPRARRSALDAIAPNHPVALTGWTGHGLVINSAAFNALGLSDTAADPLGGWLERDRRTGRASGRLDEYAEYAVLRSLGSSAPDSVLVAALQGQAAAAAGFGITTVQNMATAMPPAVFAHIARVAALPIRHRIIRFPMPSADTGAAGTWGNLGVDVGLTTVSGTKWIVDGTPFERLALLRAPYADRPGVRGRLNFPADTLRAFLSRAMANGDQPMFHVVGDSAVALILGVMTSVAPDSVWRRLRVRLEHGDGIAPDQRESVRRLGVIVVQNPSHFAIAQAIRQRLGESRRRAYQPFRSLIAAGIPIAIGSDGPLNPFLNIMFATLHPVNPSEGLTREQAVVAYTRGSAFAERAEGQKGTLAPGMLADLAVLSQDIFTVAPPVLPATVSVLTIVGGRIVHDAKAVTAAPDSR